MKRSASIEQSPDSKRDKKSTSGGGGGTGSASSSGSAGSPKFDSTKPIDKMSCDNVVNFLLRLACQVRCIKRT